MFSHSLMSETSRQLLAAATTAFALTELLVEQGVIRQDDLAARQETVRASLMEQVESSGLGLFVNDKDKDKYEIRDHPPINCAERVHLCKAACCTLRFPLSRQDVEEGVVRWDFGRPYWNLVSKSGYCVHCSPEKRSCEVYENRPGPCRSFDCREDKRIWLDFEGMVVNPKLEVAIGGLVQIKS
jgi:Fe-S-cluster containining protein